MYSNNQKGQKGRYFPTLLDRLQDDEPKSPHDRVRPVDLRTMRQYVQRDIADLMNHTNIEDTLDRERYESVIGSVLNYGVPALIGSQVNHHNWNIIEKTIRETILRFEPRIIPETLLIRSRQQSDTLARYSTITFEIRGLIYWYPQPADLCINGSYDFESEKVELKLM